MKFAHLVLLILLTAALAAVDAAALRWDRQEIVVLRTVFAEHTPAERALRSINRFEELARQDGPQRAGSRETPDGTLIEIDGKGALLITDGDADRLIGETRASVVASATASLQSALDARRKISSEQGLIDAVLIAGSAIAAWIILGWLVLHLRKRLVRGLAPLADLATPATGSMALRWVRNDLLRTTSVWGINLLAVAALLALTSICSTIGLSSLPSTHRWAGEVIESLTTMLWDLFVAVRGSLPGLLMAVAIFTAAGAATMVLNRVFRSVRAGRLQMGWIDVHTVRPTSLLSTVVLWGAAVVMAYPYLPGSSSEAFKGITVLIGLMVSLGASSQVGQLASGFILIYLRSLRPGDYVRVAECEGTVKDIGLFTMTLTTPFNEVVSLPNVVVLGSQVTNYSRPAAGSTAQLQAPVTIGYDTSWRQVHEVLHAAVQGVAGVIHAPPPVVLQRALSDFYVEYTLCVHITEPSARVQVLSALNAAILDRFHAAGIQVMSPHYLGDPAKPKVAAVPAPDAR